MARWISKITNAGLTLLARTPNNNFVFTKAECGSGTVNAAVLVTQTQVTNFKKSLLISGCIATNNQVSLRVQLNNENVSAGFLLHQIGIYAKLATDNTDILFMILQTDLADFIPSVTESPNYVCDYVVSTVISNASSITANVDPAGYVTQGQLEEILAGLEDVELKDNVEQIKQEIGEANDAPSSSTTGTTISIFAKLNYLVLQISSYLNNINVRLGGQNDTASSSTSSSAHAKLNWFLNLFGKTDDSGGSVTAGTVMAKENAILSAVNKIIEHTSADVLDNDVIKAGTNLQKPVFANLPATYTEILNINGGGYLSSIYLQSSAAGNTVKVRIYIDDELFFSYGVVAHGSNKYGQMLSCLASTGSTMFTGNMIPNLNDFINGRVRVLSNTQTDYIANRLLHFENNLRILAYSVTATNDDYVSVYYALKE